ncbi:MAG: STAS domain-containing protein [Chitinophagales bacterium]
MKFLIDKKERFCSIAPAEEKLTALQAPSLKTEFIMLNSEGFRNIICDMTAIKYVDSSGLSSLLTGHRLCDEVEGKFVLCGAQEEILKLMKLSQLDSVITLMPTLQEAIDFVMLNELERDLK